MTRGQLAEVTVGWPFCLSGLEDLPCRVDVESRLIARTIQLKTRTKTNELALGIRLVARGVWLPNLANEFRDAGLKVE